MILDFVRFYGICLLTAWIFFMLGRLFERTGEGRE